MTNDQARNGSGKALADCLLFRHLSIRHWGLIRIGFGFRFLSIVYHRTPLNRRRHFLPISLPDTSSARHQTAARVQQQVAHVHLAQASRIARKWSRVFQVIRRIWPGRAFRRSLARSRFQKGSIANGIPVHRSPSSGAGSPRGALCRGDGRFNQGSALSKRSLMTITIPDGQCARHLVQQRGDAGLVAVLSRRAFADAHQLRRRSADEVAHFVVEGARPPSLVGAG